MLRCLASTRHVYTSANATDALSSLLVHNAGRYTNTRCSWSRPLLRGPRGKVPAKTVALTSSVVQVLSGWAGAEQDMLLVWSARFGLSLSGVGRDRPKVGQASLFPLKIKETVQPLHLSWLPTFQHTFVGARFGLELKQPCQTIKIHQRQHQCCNQQSSIVGHSHNLCQDYNADSIKMQTMRSLSH